MEKIKKAWNKYIYIYIWILIIGLTAHLFALTNKLINHDELSCLFSKGGTYSLGRWGLVLISYVLPNISMPFFHGIITLGCIALSACIISEIFEIKNKIFQFLIGGIMITFPSITGTLCYMFTSSSYGFAIFLSVISVYTIKKKNWKMDLIGILCLIFSLSIYQAYISVTASLLIILLIKDCLDEEKDIKQVLLIAVRYLIILGISLGIYFVLTKLINSFVGKSFSSYQGFNTLGEVTIKSLIIGVLTCYKSVVAIFLIGWNGIAYNGILKLIVFVLGILDAIIIIFSFNKARKANVLKGLLLLMFVAILPMTMNMLYILNPKVEMHGLMVLGNVMIFLIPIFLYEENKNVRKIEFVKNISIVALIIVIFQYITLANECYTRMFFTYENTFAFFNTLSTRIQDTEDFDSDTKIAIIGKFNNELLTNTDEKFLNTFSVTGTRSARQLINKYQEFFRYYIGIDYKYASQNEIDEIIKTAEYGEMNIYPYDNSIKNINNIIVVKCEETNKVKEEK